MWVGRGVLKLLINIDKVREVCKQQKWSNLAFSYREDLAKELLIKMMGDKRIALYTFNRCSHVNLNFHAMVNYIVNQNWLILLT